jgi:two-component system LytT family response regulator
MIRAIIIDDHPHAIALLQNDLAAVSLDINVIGTATNPSDGYSMIAEKSPDLVFLDIDMPGMNGFDLLSHFPSPSLR